MVTIGGGMDGIRHPLGCGATQIGGGADGVDPLGTPVTLTLLRSMDGKKRCRQLITCKQGCGTIPKRMQEMFLNGTLLPEL